MKFFPQSSATHQSGRFDFSLMPNSLCGIIINETNVSSSVGSEAHLRQWWPEQIKKIKIEITKHRNNIIRTVRKRYLGKTQHHFNKTVTQ